MIELHTQNYLTFQQHSLIANSTAENLNRVQNFQLNLSKHEVFISKWINKFSGNLIQKNKNTQKKLISGKMRKKLFIWLQNIAKQSFSFSNETIFLCFKIIDQYLKMTNQSPSQLQLIGCSALYLASKVHQRKIVSHQSYILASMNIFSKKQLQDKEKIILSQLNYCISFCTYAKLLNLYCSLFELQKEKKKQMLITLQAIVKDQRSLQHSEKKLIDFCLKESFNPSFDFKSMTNEQIFDRLETFTKFQ